MVTSRFVMWRTQSRNLKYSLINALKERIQCQQMTGKSTTSLSFLPDDQQRHGMETETVALLPVLRRLEVVVSKERIPYLLPEDFFICCFQVIVGGSGAASSLAGLRLLLEHLSHTQVFNKSTCRIHSCLHPPGCTKSSW